MTSRIIIAAAALLFGLSQAAAQSGHYRAAPGCVDARKPFSLFEMIFSTGHEPQANGCAPAVYSGGRFIGQDPDPNVRLELRRNADNEGYHLNTR